MGQSVAKLEQIEKGALVLWVYGIELWKCIYDEKLELTTIFTKFYGCIGTL